MKMRKLLASGVAASLAVTSMATVASAAEKTFDMTISSGEIAVTKNIVKELGKEFHLDSGEFDKGALGMSSTNDYLVLSTAWDLGVWHTGLTLKVTGIKGDRDSATPATYEYKFLRVIDYNTYVNGLIAKGKVKADWSNAPQPTFTDENGTKWIHVNDWTGNEFALKLCQGQTAGNEDVTEFLPEVFSEINKIELIATGNYSTSNEGVYNKFGDTFAKVSDAVGKKAAGFSYINGLATDNAATKMGSMLLEAIDSINDYNYGSKKVNTNYPILSETEKDDPTTDYNEYNDKKLYRNEVLKLSATGDHASDSAADNSQGTTTDGNQTYANGDYTQGTAAKAFAGLASQTAEFFNHKTNGTITFKFTSSTAASNSGWVNGGIPSTEVGLQNVLEGAVEQDFAIFFNYGNTSGTMLSAVKVDPTSGTVVFDIESYLADCAGLTKATLENIYYGLTYDTSIDYDNDGEKDGLKIESITLAYDEDADADADIEDDTADDDADEDDDVADDTADDDADEDDDASIDEDDDDADEDDDADADDADDDDTDVAGDVVTGGEDDDTNPATGVALAVVPALVAAAAAVVSKKRK